jgi:hypothetical protein
MPRAKGKRMLIEGGLCALASPVFGPPVSVEDDGDAAHQRRNPDEQRQLIGDGGGAGRHEAQRPQEPPTPPPSTSTCHGRKGTATTAST